MLLIYTNTQYNKNIVIVKSRSVRKLKSWGVIVHVFTLQGIVSAPTVDTRKPSEAYSRLGSVS
jgi:hypothetical protein